MKNILLLLTILFSSFSFALRAQEKARFSDDIQCIKQFDKIYPPPANPILFVGSSSIRLWGNLQTSFPSYTVLNRGIGGAVISDINYWIDELVVAYNPKQIVVYVGENDLPNESYSSDSIAAKAIQLVKLMRQKLPMVPILYISMKPSPVREKYLAKLTAANLLIRKYILTQNGMQFIDICPPMIGLDGKPKQELFLTDKLHMNPLGYAIWTKEITPFLVK